MVLCCFLKYSHFQSSLEFACLVNDTTNLGWGLSLFCALAIVYSSKTMLTATLFNFCAADGYLKMKHQHEYWCLCTYRGKKNAECIPFSLKTARFQNILKSWKMSKLGTQENFILQKLMFSTSFWLQSCYYANEDLNKVKPFIHQ